MSNYPVESQSLHVPSLQDVAEILQTGLQKCFAEAKVEVVQCPDLTKSPYNMAAPGICGSPRIADVGGVPYLTPSAKLDKIYDFKDIAKDIELPGAFFVGAGAGPHPHVGANCEMMANLFCDKVTKNDSRISKIDPSSGSCLLETLPAEETRCALMFNLFASEGKPGPVLKVSAKRRTGEDNFVSCMRKALEDNYGDDPVGLGGAFYLVKGSARCHVMPEFSKTPLNSIDEVNNWLKFFNMPAPMIFLSVFVSRDPGLDLRIEHSHGYGASCGGHYHYDVTPKEVEYEGYFGIGEKIFRVDRPENTNK